MIWENEIETPYKKDPLQDYKKEIEPMLIAKKQSVMSLLFSSYYFSITLLTTFTISVFTLLWLSTTTNGYNEYGAWNRGEPSIIIFTYIGFALAGIFVGWCIPWTVRYKMASSILNNIDKFYILKRYTSNVDGLTFHNFNWNTYSPHTDGFVYPMGKYGKVKHAPEGSFLINGSFKNFNFEFTTSKWIVRSPLKRSDIAIGTLGLMSGTSTLDGPREEFVSQIVIKDSIFDSFNETYISPVSTFLNVEAITIEKGKMKKVQFANDSFNTLFNVYGDDLNLHKLFNATEQENYITLYKMFPYASLQINKGVMYITFPTPESFKYKKNYSLSDLKIDSSIIENQMLQSITSFFNAFSYFTLLRKIQG